MSRHVLLSLPLCMLAGGLSAQTVLNATDMTSLRTHISTANTGTGDYTINLAAGTYTMTGAAGDNTNAAGDLDILKSNANLTIAGAGAATTIVDGASIDRLFHVNAGTTITVTFKDLTIQNGKAVDNGTATTEARGGGIYVQSNTNLVLTNVVLKNNQALGGNGAAGGVGAAGGAGVTARGGGVYISGGTVTISGTTFNTNKTIGGNGGNGGAGQNYASSGYSYVYGGAGGSGGSGGNGQGGAIYVAGGTVNVTQSTLNANTTKGGNAGNGGKGGDATYSGTSYYPSAVGGGGAAGGAGGAAQGAGTYLAAGSLNLTNSTVSANTGTAGNGAVGGAGGNATNYYYYYYVVAGNGGNGGNSGLPRGANNYIGGGTAVMNNSTVVSAANAAGTAGAGGVKGSGSSSTSAYSGSSGTVQASQGGGAYVTAGTLAINSTIFANNTSSTGPDISGTVTANNSLIKTTTGASIGGSANVLNQDPNLSALANNGGPTQTHALPGTGSPALDVGSNPGALSTDQRGSGFVRSSGAGVDIGAFEFQNTPPAAPTVSAPAAAITINANTYNIQGSAVAGTLVRIYNDANNNNVIDTGETVVASQQLTTGVTAFSVSTTLTQNAANNFLATCYNGSLESSPTDVPTITEDSVAPAQPAVTSPAAVVSVQATTFSIVGTAEANALVEVVRDLNNNGAVDAGEPVVGSQQLTAGGTAFSISTPLLSAQANNFVVIATDAAANVSNPADVPTITQDSIAPAAPVVTDPATAISLSATAYNIQGSAEANALVKIYSDTNNNGIVDAGENMVASQQLTGGATAWAISTPLTSYVANNFVATATDAAGNVSTAADVPTITDTTLPPTNPPTVTAPSVALTLNQSSYNIAGTAPVNALVRVYTDANNNGQIDGGDAMVAQQQLSGGQILFSIGTPIVQNSANNFTVTAQGTGAAESTPTNVPTITDDAGFSSGTGTGTGGGGGGCAADPAAQGPWMLALGAIGAMLLALRSWLVRRA